MRHLISFSVSRRFKNKVTIVLHLIMLCLFFGSIFSDKIIMKLFKESDQLSIIFCDKSVDDFIPYLNNDNNLYKFKSGYNEKEINLKFNNFWIIESEFPLDPISSQTLKIIIENAIIDKWLDEISDQSATVVLENIFPQIEEITTFNTGMSADKQNISMIMITGIYFAMLSFSTMIANEVVYEKTSRVLELVLTSVSTTTHYLSKMIVGWLTILIQLVLVIFEASIVILTRNYYDQGLGLLKMLQKYGLLQIKASTFKELLKALDINYKLVFVLITSLMFLFLGIVIIQMIMVCISSFIKSIEESSVIQAPVYLVLLVIYYLALALNSPNRLNVGLGYYLSFVPIFSMLFMPMRLLLLNVYYYEIGLSLLTSIVTLAITTYYGAYIYKIGILGGLKKKRKTFSK